MTASPHEAVDEAFVPKRADAVYTVEIDGEAVLLDEDGGRLHLLSATATLVWRCYDGRASLAAIVADLSEILGLDYQTVLADTLAVTRELAREGLVHATEAAVRRRRVGCR
jgi:hypothetical protein